ncbi:hypothetical protein [Calidifontibacillus erzurumensis]|uniref:Uncharacterized protein n=1 Tax=Calidifontibacillus erzurumensis TaxID=2741433 RepID=A0A8J8GE99_9BACI|nr:hypothetical protein [Calidifontibacillus erzurumensis]NSL50808.1 hypothetical protein [Calidifontibacillus erzurumensis]
MKWIGILGVSFIIVCIFFIQWPKMKKYSLKEKIVFLSMTFLGWILALLLIIFPDLPGPTQLIDTIFKPLGKILEL